MKDNARVERIKSEVAAVMRHGIGADPREFMIVLGMAAGAVIASAWNAPERPAALAAHVKIISAIIAQRPETP
jgi:hypothetical protein